MNTKGFIAVIAVIMIAFTLTAYSYIVMASAISYADSVNRHEWRIQANLNNESCVSTVALMAMKDYFLEGEVKVPEFGCVAFITRNHLIKQMTVRAQSVFIGVSSATTSQVFIVF